MRAFRHFLRPPNSLLAILIPCLSLSLSCRSRNASKPTATPEDRKVIGTALPYAPPLPAQELMTMPQRRAYAWKVFEKTLQPAPIGKAVSGAGFTPEERPFLPLWQTFYDSTEFVEMFDRLYSGLGPEGRKGKKPFCPQDVKTVFIDHSQKSLRGWTSNMLEQRLGQLRNLEDVLGVSGTGMTLFSPATFGHLLTNYKSQIQCKRSEQVIDAKQPPVQADNHSACATSEFPSGSSRLENWEGPDYEHCRGREGWADGKAWTGKELGTSIAIKAAWSYVGDTDEIGVFSSDAEGLQNALTKGTWTVDSMKPSHELTPDKIYTIRLQPSGRMYRLVGLHIVTKELRHWSWITLWWANDPNKDFGEDRPSTISGPWANYKMCVVTDYNELGSSPGGEFRRMGLKSLADSLDVAHAFAKPQSWCSNPFIELGPGNSRSNCIGCHQHAGAAENPEDIYKDVPSDPKNEERRKRFPNDGRSRLRENFPSDYLWSLTFAPDFFQDSINNKAFETDQADELGE